MDRTEELWQSHQDVERGANWVTVGCRRANGKINSKSPKVSLHFSFIILLVKTTPKSIMDLAGIVFIGVLFIIWKQNQNQFEHEVNE